MVLVVNLISLILLRFIILQHGNLTIAIVKFTVGLPQLILFYLNISATFFCGSASCYDLRVELFRPATQGSDLSLFFL